MDPLGTDSCRGTVPMEPPMSNGSMPHRELFNSDPAARGTGKTPGFISLLKMLTGVSQFAAPEHHHPTETLETVQFGVSNVPGGLLGPEISQVEGWPIVKNVTKISPEFHENKIILQLTQ